MIGQATLPWISLAPTVSVLESPRSLLPIAKNTANERVGKAINLADFRDCKCPQSPLMALDVSYMKGGYGGLCKISLFSLPLASEYFCTNNRCPS